MKTIINNTEYKLTKVTLGMAIKYQKEFEKDIFVEASKIDIKKGYIDIDDMLIICDILYCSTWFVDKETDYETFKDNFLTLSKNDVERMIFEEINYVFTGMDTTVESEKK